MTDGETAKRTLSEINIETNARKHRERAEHTAKIEDATKADRKRRDASLKKRGIKPPVDA